MAFGDKPTAPIKGSAAAFTKRLQKSAESYTANGYHDPNLKSQIEVETFADAMKEPVPDRPWLVPDYIPLRTVTLLTGDGGVGKSLLAQQLMTCVATGALWLGMPSMVGPAYGLFCEDERDELRRRQADICRVLGLDCGELKQTYFSDRASEDAVLFGPDPEDKWAFALTALFYDFCKRLHAIKPKLVVIDTAADTFEGNENIRAQVRRFIRELRSLAMDLDAAIVLCAHPSLTGISTGTGISGSTGWHNSVRSRLYLTKPEDAPDTDLRILSAKKANYGPLSGELQIRWRGGCFIKDQPDGGTVGRIERSNQAKQIIELVRSQAILGRHLSKQPRAGDRYLPPMAARHLKLRLTTAKTIMYELLMDGVIEEKMVDTDHKRRGLVVTETPETGVLTR